ncbi:MAG: TIGR03668 family PPOX class F420-dependent oxidoreductase [bacterium]
MDSRFFLSWHISLIEELRVARLATIGPGGRPHLVPFCYALLGDVLVMPVDEKPKRSQLLQRLKNVGADPRVTVLFDRYEDDWTKLAWVRVEGLAEVVEGVSIPLALAALRGRYSQYLEMDLESRPLMTIKPQAVSGWRWVEDPRRGGPG